MVETIMPILGMHGAPDIRPLFTSCSGIRSDTGYGSLHSRMISGYQKGPDIRPNVQFGLLKQRPKNSNYSKKLRFQILLRKQKTI